MRQLRSNRDILARVDPNLFSKSSVTGNGYFFGNTNLGVWERFRKRRYLSENNILRFFWNPRE